jgi:hypothetical protein
MDRLIPLIKQTKFKNNIFTLPLKSEKIIKPLGPTSPWVWVLEPTHGCNLRCGHCNCRLDPLPKQYHFMSEKTWIETWKIIAQVTPTCRIDVCLGGEPLLHNDMLQFLKIARRISPHSQIQITTNGTMLLNGKYTYKQLLDAGANSIYTDMYGPKNRYIELAEASGFKWYEYYNAPVNAPSTWRYWGPKFKIIVLQLQPEHWPKSRLRAGLLGTWLNHLDWKAAARFGLHKVVTPIARRCNQPFLQVNVDSKGNYLLCCQDNTGETSGLFGNVSKSVNGFKLFWYGKRIQIIRRKLRQKNRAGDLYCSRCCVTFSRCDLKHWTDQEVNTYWNGEEWCKFKRTEKPINEN